MKEGTYYRKKSENSYYKAENYKDINKVFKSVNKLLSRNNLINIIIIKHIDFIILLI